MMIKNIDFLTVGTINYLPQVLVTLNSAKKHSNYSSYHFFAIDATSESIISLRNFLKYEYSWLNIFGPDDLERDKELFLKSFEYFNPLELSCFAKYLGVAHVINISITADICVYSDADIFFTGDPIPTILEMGEASILVTPHQFKPSTEIQEQEYLLYGFLNAGFFAVNRSAKNTSEILNWLINRISRLGFLAPSIGLYVDQVWLSLVSAFFSGDTLICRHLGFNVAYWNLHERTLSEHSGSLHVESQKLIFFHFSGFVGAKTNQLTKHCYSLISDNSSLKSLCSKYQSALNEAEMTAARLPACSNLQSCGLVIEKRILRGPMQKNNLSFQSLSLRHGPFSKLGMKVDLIAFRWLQ